MAHTDFSADLQNASEIEITVTGRTSGRSLTYPIWFAVDGDKLYLIPVKGSDTEWYKNLRKTPTIRLTARRKTLTASPVFSPTRSNSTRSLRSSEQNTEGT
jgi:hypothetical protein